MEWLWLLWYSFFGWSVTCSLMAGRWHRKSIKVLNKSIEMLDATDNGNTYAVLHVLDVVEAHKRQSDMYAAEARKWSQRDPISKLFKKVFKL